MGQIDFNWIQIHWKELLVGVMIGREFLNNLLNNCPYLKANKSIELVQGIFNAAAQTITKQKPVEETKKDDLL